MSLIEKIRNFSQARPHLAQLILSLAVILIGVIIYVVLMATREDVVRTKSSIPPPYMSTISAEVGLNSVRITGEGTVKPLREINLVPQVSGKVVYISPALADGGRFEKGEILLRIDPIDYELAVKSAEARVKDLESMLLLAVEEAEVSREEWKLSGEGKENEEPPPLVAKQPQLDAARASLAAGNADLEKARLNLKRTTIRSPFEGRIMQKNVDIGQFVSVGQQLGSMFSIEAAEIAVPMPQEDLEWLYVPGFTRDGGGDGGVIVRAEIAGETREWSGRTMRAEGMLDERTRMINVIVRVERPYATIPPLAMGLFVSVEFTGTQLTGSLWLPRSAIHEDNTVWIIDGESRLRFREVEVARFDGNKALVTGIADGELVAVTPSNIVTDGMKVNHHPLEGQEHR